MERAKLLLLRALRLYRQVGLPARLSAMAALGVLLGLAACVAWISHAGSYISDDPRACINCHIMFPEYATCACACREE